MDLHRAGTNTLGGDQTSTVEGSEGGLPDHDRRLHRFPLAFLDHKTEMTFASLSMQSFYFRGRIAAALLALVTVVMWAVFLPLLHTKMLPTSCYSALWLLDLGHAVALACCACLFFLSSSSLTPPWLELVVLFVPLPLVILWTGWILGEISHTEWEGTINDTFRAVKSMTYEFKLYSDHILLVLLFIAVVVYDQIFQCRTSRSLYFHVFLGALYGTVRVFEGVFLAEKFAPSVMLVIRIVETAQCLFVVVVLSVTFVGRYNKEAADRQTFLCIEEDQLRLKRLRREQCRKIGTRGETVTESLIHRIRKTRLDVQHAAFELHHHGDTKLLQGDEILRQCVEILLNCDQLTAMPSKRQDPNMGDEKNAELQYLRILAGNAQDNSPTRELSDVENTTNRPMGCDLTIPDIPQDPYYTGDRAAHIQADPALAESFGTDPFLDLLQVYGEYPHILVEVGTALLRPRLAQLRIPEKVAINYLCQLEGKYWNNPYHNKCHGAMVAHMWQCLVASLNLVDCITPIQHTAALVAALAHDVGHPGRNNSFYINWGSMVAFLYNDHAILERYHCMLAFRMAQVGIEVNIFQNLTRREYVQIRSLMIEFILATDMSQHFSSISKFRLRREAGTFKPYEDPEDIKLMIRMCGKLADLSHGFVDWPQHLEWSWRVAEEFYQQGLEEATLGLPVSPLCDRTEHADWAKSQSGFLQFVVLPLVSEMSEVNSDCAFRDFMEKLMRNKSAWDEARDTHKEFPIPLRIQDLRVPPAALPDIYTLMLIRARTVQNSNANPLVMSVRPQDPTLHKREESRSPAPPRPSPTPMPPPPSQVPSPFPMLHTRSLTPAEPPLPILLPELDPMKPATVQALQPTETPTPPSTNPDACLRIAVKEPSPPPTPSLTKKNKRTDADVTSYSSLHP